MYNLWRKTSQGIFVLDDQTPEKVAKAMIKSGLQKEPFHVFDMDEAHRRIQHFRELMPRIKIFYAMKSNDNERMLQLVISQGLGFDCASPGEIYKIKQMNVNPLSIIYAMATKTPEQMMYARESGVKHTTFDTSYELKKIKEYWPDAKLLIRIRVESNSKYKLGEKFGCEFDDAKDLLDEAAALGLCVTGVAFHVGSVCFTKESYELGLRRARALFDHEEMAGRCMKIVDIGGGFLSDRIDRIDEAAEVINRCLEELFPNPEVQVIAEPGRYLCDSAFTFYCNINNVRRVLKNNNPVNILYINDGIYGTLRVPESWHIVKKFDCSSSEPKEIVKEPTILFGPSCAFCDQILKDYDIRLPRCSPVDWLVFKMQGAYTFVHASRFSCLPEPMVRSVISRKLWNELKYSRAFNMEDFVEKPDISLPLPTTLPPVVKVTHDSKTAALVL